MNYPEFCTLAKSDRIVDSYTGKIITFNLKDSLHPEKPNNGLQENVPP